MSTKVKKARSNFVCPFLFFCPTVFFLAPDPERTSIGSEIFTDTGHWNFGVCDKKSV